MAKRPKNAVSASKLVHTAIDSRKTRQPALKREIEGKSDKPQGYAIGTSGLLARRVLALHQRVVVGSWQRKDGSRGENYAWYCTYETKCVGIPMMGMALVSESDMTLIKPRVLSFEEFAERKAKAA